MGQRQIIWLSMVVALVSVSVFAYYRVKRISITSATGNRTADPQSPDVKQNPAVPIFEIEADHQETSQPDDRPPSSQGFVGSDACAKCHQELMDSYRKHPMYWGSIRLVSEDGNQPASTKSPIPGKKRALASQTSGNKIVHHEMMYDVQGNKIYDDAVEQKFVIGSGRRARAYVHEQEGVLCLSPLNWFSRENRWELNPGYRPDDPRRFDRRANTICLQCHSGRLNPKQHGSEFLLEKPFDEMAIGCEKCHGPGSEHISFHKTPGSQAKDNIVNPQRLDRFRRESVCYQCHLQPSSARILRPGRSHLDFRPGMRLDDVWIVMNSRGSVDAEGKTDSVRQVQQMMESQCYVKSANMSCTSCHDPHAVPEQHRRTEVFRDRCLSCHTNPNQCLAPNDERTAVADSCIDCHMPKLDLVSSAHVSQTDHRIVLNKSVNSVDRSRPVNPSEFVFEETNELPDLEKRRAIAIVNVKNGLTSNELIEELQFLKSQFPGDGFLSLALAGVSVARSDYYSALESLQHAATCPQTEELALETLTQIAYFAQDWPSAFKAFEMSLRLNPYRAQTLAIKADALFRTGQTQHSIDTAKEALKHNPSLIEVHQWLKDTYQKLGKIQEAEAERVIVEQMQTAKPPIQEVGPQAKD